MTEAHKCAQMRILFCSKTFPAARRNLEQRLKPSDYELVVCPEDDISSALDGVNVVIPLMCRIDSALMDAGSFRLIQQWGSGLEGVDLQAARQRGIRVANVPAAGSNADSVAEHVILLTFALLRDLSGSSRECEGGELGCATRANARLSDRMSLRSWGHRQSARKKAPGVQCAPGGHHA